MLSRSDEEEQKLEDLFELKIQKPYLANYKSSAVETDNPVLGTIEKDAAGHFGRFVKEDFRAFELAAYVLHDQPKSLLDVGAGNLLAASYFSHHGILTDICDFESSPYFSVPEAVRSGVNQFHFGDFATMEINKKYNAVWCSHVLEHILNVDQFLRKIHSVLIDDGYLYISVPPRKPFMVSGHVNLFTPGLLVYRLILAGFNCKLATVFQYDYNICVRVKKDNSILTNEDLNFDIGDLEKLKNYFPVDISEGINGDWLEVNHYLNSKF